LMRYGTLVRSWLVARLARAERVRGRDPFIGGLRAAG